MNIFLNRPEPIDGESLTGYLCRVSRANYYDLPIRGMEWGLKYGEFESNCFPEEVIENLSNSLLMDKQQLQKMTTNFYSAPWTEKVRKTAILKTRLKFCVECLKEGIIHKIDWCFNPINVCLTHKVLLIRGCKKCKNHLRINDLFLQKCRFCNIKISRLEPDRINHEDLLLEQKKLFGLIKGEKISLLSRNMSFEEYLDLAYGLFQLLDGLQSFIAPKSKIHVLLTNKDAFYVQLNSMIAFGNIRWIFEDFPQNFYKVLDRFNKSIPEQRKRRRARFERLLKNEKYVVLKQSYEEYWHNKVRNNEVSKNHKFNSVKDNLFKEFNYYCKTDLIHLGFTEAQVNSICENNNQIQRFNHGGQYRYRIPKSEVVKHLQKLEATRVDRVDLITKKNAAKLLGTSVRTVTLFLKENQLKWVSVPYSQQRFISKKSVLTILRELQQNVSQMDTDIMTILSFRKIMKVYGPKGLNCYKLYQLIKEREIKVYALNTKPLLVDLHFDKRELDKVNFK